MFKVTPPLTDKIKHFSNYPQTSLSLRQMAMIGRRPLPFSFFRASQFLQEELAIRLAHRIKDFEELPPVLRNIPSIVKVKNLYMHSFKDLVDLPSVKLTSENENRSQERKQATCINTYNQMHSNHFKKMHHKKSYITAPSIYSYFKQDYTIPCTPNMLEYTKNLVMTIETIKKNHESVVINMAQGFLDYQRQVENNVLVTDFQSFLDRFYLSRIGIRMLIGQHSALYKNQNTAEFIGIVCTKTKIKEIVEDAIENARFICEDYYSLLEAPKVQLICPKDIELIYVPSHLNHMVFELLKNSLRAVVERFGKDKSEASPPIKVIIACGKEDVTIKISDEGGGIPRSSIPKIWKYSYTTAEVQTIPFEFKETEYKAPIAGFGYGLPISRLYARYFGGDLKVISMEGHGTDAYIQLNRLSNSDEPLGI